MKILTSLLLFFFVSTSTLFGAQLITNKLISDAQRKYNTFAKNRFLAIRKKLIKDLKNANDMKKLNVVNTWVNYIKYASDKKVYGVSDYWATLYEFVGKGRGDCEDYTIAKYYILKELGISPKRLKFTYVVYKNRRGKRISHMVLSYLKVPKPRKKSDILILDNNNRLMLPATKRKDIVKVVKMINGDTGAKSKKWKKLEAGMRRKKL
ncbi:transglutaminase-like cysteine peptidase [Sulfurimonas sp. SAG-AH-194-I05]|nr:transglutaminase-like cysteine peptidase [Sulfurimonas sp. SAG-AH-194-I05]MDF1875263.1 transglutaminase-like cysteine peptidase [Sulfurimonas sp. SAG-AH-194-I05]